MTDNTVYIYALIDPRNDYIFYIGRTHNIKTRLNQHISESKKILEAIDNNHIEIFGIDYVLATKTNTKKHPKIKRIIEILQSNNVPTLLLIDQWDNPKSLKDENRIEDAWIAEYLRRGYKLTNHIYSHRQSYDWYKERNKQLKLKTDSPLEYIAELKSGNITHDDNTKYNWRTVKSNMRRRYAKRNKVKKKKKI